MIDLSVQNNCDDNDGFCALIFKGRCFSFKAVGDRARTLPNVENPEKPVPSSQVHYLTFFPTGNHSYLRVPTGGYPRVHMGTRGTTHGTYGGFPRVPVGTGVGTCGYRWEPMGNRVGALPLGFHGVYRGTSRGFPRATAGTHGLPHGYPRDIPRYTALMSNSVNRRNEAFLG